MNTRINSMPHKKDYNETIKSVCPPSYSGSVKDFLQPRKKNTASLTHSRKPRIAEFLWFSLPPNTHISYDYRCKKGIITFQSAFVVKIGKDKRQNRYILVRCGNRFYPLYKERIKEIRFINKDGAYPYKKEKRTIDKERFEKLARKVKEMEKFINNIKKVAKERNKKN